MNSVIVDLIMRFYPLVLGAINDVKDISETGVVKKTIVREQLLKAIRLVPIAGEWEDEILDFFDPAIDSIVAGFKLVGVIKTKKPRGKYRLVFVPDTEVSDE